MSLPGPSRLFTPTFALLVGVNFALFATFGALILALPLYVRDALGGSDLGVGIAVGAGSIGAIVAGAPAGRVADRRGRGIVLFAALGAVLAGYLVLAFEPPASVLVPSRVVAGAGEAAAVVAIYTIATDLAPPDRRGEAMSLLTVGTWAGLAIGPVIADVLLGDGRFTLVWLVASGAAAAAWLGARALPDTRPEGGEAPPGWLPPRSSLAPGLVLFLAGIGFGGFNAFAALHAREVGLEHPGLVFLLCGGIVVAVRIFGRRLPDRLGPRVGASFATSTIACGLLVIGVWPSEAGLLAGVAIFGFGQALAYPSIILLAMARARPAERSAAVGATALFIDLSLAGGAFLLGWAAHAYDYRAVFLAGSVAAVTGLVVLRATTARPAPVLETAP